MRLRILLPFAVLTSLVGVLVFELRSRWPTTLGDVARSRTDQEVAEPAFADARETPASNAVEFSRAEPEASDVSQVGGDKYAAAVQQRIAYIFDLSMETDTASLTGILEELQNENAEIRAAACSAAVQFGSRDALPALQDALSRATDAHERADLANAIDFLGLTNVLERVH